MGLFSLGLGLGVGVTMATPVAGGSGTNGGGSIPNLLADPTFATHFAKGIDVGGHVSVGTVGGKPAIIGDGGNSQNVFVYFDLTGAIPAGHHCQISFSLSGGTGNEKWMSSHAKAAIGNFTDGAADPLFLDDEDPGDGLIVSRTITAANEDQLQFTFGAGAACSIWSVVVTDLNA